MWGLVLVGIVMAYPVNKTTGSLELRFETKEECMAAKEKIDSASQFKKNRIMTSCTYRGYLL
jgi:hypothetical protein